jgi:hypothetical protein
MICPSRRLLKLPYEICFTVSVQDFKNPSVRSIPGIQDSPTRKTTRRLTFSNQFSLMRQLIPVWFCARYGVVRDLLTVKEYFKECILCEFKRVTPRYPDQGCRSGGELIVTSAKRALQLSSRVPPSHQRREPYSSLLVFLRHISEESLISLFSCSSVTSAKRAL